MGQDGAPPTRVIEAGDGPAILCLHGIGGSARTFRAQLDGLADRWRVLAWDAPGYAGSPDPSSYPGPQGYVEAIADVLDRAGIARTALLGMSWGGVLAAEFALARPDRVGALILGDSTRGSGRTPQQSEAMRARPGELDSLGAEEFARRRAQRLVADPAQADDVAAAMAASIRLPGYGHAARYMAATNLEPRLHAIAAPTLVVYGTDDIITGRVESEALAARISGAQTVPIPGAGHLANQEEPGLFNDAVRGFLSTVGDYRAARAARRPSIR